MNKAERKITELTADLNFFQIWVFADYEIDGKIVKDYEQKNNDSILTPENWEQHEVTFFTQRMATYKESYTLSEKIKLELSGLEKLPINKTDYQVLKGRYKRYLEQKQALPTQQTDTEQEQQTENDFTLSTIEDWLFEFKEKMNEADYQILVSALMNYFETDTFPTLSKPIQINGRPNKKLFGWALNRIFEAKGKGVEKELLQFANKNISLFTDVQFDETNILKSNLYKYFTTQIK